MSDLVPEIKIEVKNNQALTSSLNVAEIFGKRHDDVLKAIRNLEIPEEFRARNFAATSVVDGRGKSSPIVLLTHDGFSLLAMGFTGKKAMEWKIKYINAFNWMRETLQRQQNDEWKEARLNGKQARRELTDTIQAFVSYAKAQGSQSAHQYYVSLTRMFYKALGLIEKNGKVGPGFRNLLNSTDLNCLNMAEMVALDAIQQGMDEGMPYKDIYKFASAKVEALANQILPMLRVRRISA